jgi:iron complex outermembrane recepter protein
VIFLFKHPKLEILKILKITDNSYGFGFLKRSLSRGVKLEKRIGFHEWQLKWGRLGETCYCILVKGLVIASFALCFGVKADEALFDLDIPSQTLTSALNQFAVQTGVVMLFPVELTETRESTAVKGQMDLEEAMNLLLQNTGLSGDLSNKRVLSIYLDEVAESDEIIEDEIMSNNYSKNRSLLMGLAVALGFVGTPNGAAIAQESTELRVEEIIVTARKREESLKDVPVSISVLSSETLESGAIHDQYELFENVPNMNYAQERDRLGARSGIRGVQAQNQSALQQKVSFFLDGQPLLAHIGSVQMSGIEQVEVLRGPQNTAFGRSTFAGAINFVTTDPGAELTGEVQLGTSNLGSNAVGLYLNGPITDQLGFTLGLYQDEFGSVDEWQASDGTPLGERKTEYYTGKVVWTPTDNFDMELAASTYKVEDRQSPTPFLSEAERDACLQDALPNGLPYNAGEFNCDVSSALPSTGIPLNINPAEGLESDQLLYLWALGKSSDASVNVERDRYAAEFNFHMDNDSTVQLLTSYIEGSGYRWGDDDNSDIVPSIASVTMMGVTSVGLDGLVGMVTSTEYDQTYFDLRWLSPDDQDLRWMVGVSRFEYGYQSFRANSGFYGYLNDLEDQIEPLWLTDPRTSATAFPGEGLWSFSLRDNVSTENTGYYGSVQWDLSDRTTLSAEVRVQNDANTSEGNGGEIFTSDVTATQPRLAISHALNEDWTVYGQYSTGTNPAGVNLFFTDPATKASIDAANAAGEITYDAETYIAFDEEKVTNVELGIKGGALDGRLQLTAAIYRMEWDNMITGASFAWDGDWNDPASPDFTGVNGVVATITGTGMVFINGGTAELSGIEVEANYLINENWSVNASGVMATNEFTDACEAAITIGDYGYAPTHTVAADGVLFDCVDMNGNTIPFVPDNTLSLGATYSTDFDSGWDMRANISTFWQSEVYRDAVNSMWLGSVSTVRASLLISNGDNIDISIYGNNLTDEDQPREITWRDDDYNICGSTINCTESNFRLDGLRTPREIGARITYRF